jgi:thiamine biosynthesis lipoprotein
VVHSLASVTVLAESSMQADAWATALLVLGPELGFDLAQARGMAALLISHDGERLSARSTEEFDDQSSLTR